MPAPFYEQFNDAYMRKGQQPSTGGIVQPTKNNQSGVRNVQITKKATGTSMRATGAGMQVAGKGMKAAGKASTRAGASLSSTGVGAIVGVPLMAVGGVATGVGVGTEVAGKQVSRAGRQMSKKSRSSKLSLKDLTTRGFSVHVRALMTGLFFVTPIIWLAMWEILFLGLTFAVDAVTETKVNDEDGLAVQAWKATVGGIMTIFNSLSDAISSLTGGFIDIAGILGSLHPGNFFAAFYVFTFAFCLMTLISVGFVYEFSGSKPFSGSGASAKKAAFLVALCFYALPVVHILPWFLVWTYAIKKNGR